MPFQTLIDNTFSNVISPEAISGNLTATISDHLPQFIFVPNVFYNSPSNKSNNYVREWSKFDQESFIQEKNQYFSYDWNEILKIEKRNIDYSMNIFLNKFNTLLDNTPLKKANKYMLKFTSKSWKTPGLQKPIL